MLIKLIVPALELFPPSFSTCILTQAEVNSIRGNYSRKYSIHSGGQQNRQLLGDMIAYDIVSDMVMKVPGSSDG